MHFCHFITNSNPYGKSVSVAKIYNNSFWIQNKTKKKPKDIKK